MVTFGADLEIGRAGYVAVDSDSGPKHEIRLRKPVTLAEYGEGPLEARRRTAAIEATISTMDEARLGLKAGGDKEMARLTTKSLTCVNPKLVNDDNVCVVWAEKVFNEIVRNMSDAQKAVAGPSSYSRRYQAVVRDHNKAVSMPTKVMGAGKSVVFSMHQLIERDS